jgi:prolyl oligopeptidase
VDDYYGTTVEDPYRWMEDGKHPELLPWLRAQDAHARSTLARIAGRDALQKKVSALSGNLSVTKKVVMSESGLFFEQQPAGAQNYTLFVREPSGTRRTLVDPTRLTIDGQHASLDWWQPDEAGRFVVYGLSPGGSEASIAHVLEIATGRTLEERIPNTDWGVTGWLPDGSGFLYSQFTGERGTPTFYWNSVVKLHRLHTDPRQDPVVLRRGLYSEVPILEVQAPIVQPIPSSELVLLMIVDVRQERALWVAKLTDLVAGKPDFLRVATADDLVVSVAASGDDLFLLSNKDRPRGRVLMTSLAKPSLSTATEVLPQSKVVAESIHPIRGGVLVRTMDGGVQRLVQVTRSGKPRPIGLPFIGSVRDVFSSNSREEAHVSLAGWLEPPAVWHITRDLSVRPTDLDPKPPFDLSGYVAGRRFATARDGTRVPYTLIARRGWRADGKNPVLAEAYGAYQYAVSPSFQARLLAFLDAGGVFAIAHVRGGGEYGREWHKGGQKATKPNTWRDFIDVCQVLIDTKVTTSRRLVIQGTSAGGVAVGRALTERPDLFAGAISDVGFANPLRYAAEQNNADVDEWGPMVDAETFRHLYAMDTYHAVKDNTAYPPVLVISGYNDPRVATFHAAKLTARLQAANISRAPTLLRIDFESGHGMGSTRGHRDALLADMYAFTLWCAGARKMGKEA